MQTKRMQLLQVTVIHCYQYDQYDQLHMYSIL